MVTSIKSGQIILAFMAHDTWHLATSWQHKILLLHDVSIFTFKFCPQLSFLRENIFLFVFNFLSKQFRRETLYLARGEQVSTV